MSFSADSKTINTYWIRNDYCFFSFFFFYPVKKKKIVRLLLLLRCVGEAFLLPGMLIRSSRVCSVLRSLKFLFALPSVHQVNSWPLSIFIY